MVSGGMDRCIRMLTIKTSKHHLYEQLNRCSELTVIANRYCEPF